MAYTDVRLGITTVAPVDSPIWRSASILDHDQPHLPPLGDPGRLVGKSGILNCAYAPRAHGVVYYDGLTVSPPRFRGGLVGEHRHDSQHVSQRCCSHSCNPWRQAVRKYTFHFFLSPIVLDITCGKRYFLRCFCSRSGLASRSWTK